MPTAIEALDLSILRALYAGGSSDVWVHVVLGVTFLGSGWLLLALLPALFRHAWRSRALSLLVTLGATSAVVSATKAVVGRVRPCYAVNWAHTLPIEFPTDPSFPSGHSAGSFAFAFFILARKPRVGGVLVVLATSIALSRVALGVHYPSDVFVGALLGALLGFSGSVWTRNREARLPTVGVLPHADSESIGQ